MMVILLMERDYKVLPHNRLNSLLTNLQTHLNKYTR